MIVFDELELWLIAGSQHLYGSETLAQVASNLQAVAGGLADDPRIPIRIVAKSVLTTQAEITGLCKEANYTDPCVGLIVWMHTFSPAKMWINGLKVLHKPLLHLHTQFHRGIPWSEIDMDYMNLHQSAHGGREFGFICTRLGVRRSVVVGHRQDPAVAGQIAVWSRVSAAWADAQGMKVARFGDNMREVAVTEGNQVSAQIHLGYSVNGFGMADLTAAIDAVSEGAIDQLVEAYGDRYDLQEDLRPQGDRHRELREAARIEVGIRRFLESGGFDAFTDTFENLHTLRQLPGIAVQRLMADGYGFGAEGDWKTAALVRTMKVMAQGLPGGNSFMEDYTYHFEEGQASVLGAHMLEICPSIASGRPRCEIHPLAIGGKSDPVRLVFGVASGPALNACMIDLGDRFQLLVNTVEVIEPPAPLPKLPVARALWQPHPDLKTAAAAWIKAGGAHHTCFSTNLTVDYLQIFADMAGIDMRVID